MSPKIYSIKDPLDLSRLRLAKPINKNGAHFIKTLDVDNPIYFLGPKCFAKQGFVKSGKKIFCDLVFSNEDSDFLEWLENLEETARGCIYANRETWFETPLDEHDIESSMSSPYKPYKSGKYFIVRANVPTALDKINIKVYDENENESDPENIKENTKVLAVLEFQGIRCSVRSFQFEIELKQILIVEPEKIFERCIIAKSAFDTISVERGGDNEVRSKKSNATPSSVPELEQSVRSENKNEILLPPSSPTESTAFDDSADPEGMSGDDTLPQQNVSSCSPQIILEEFPSLGEDINAPLNVDLQLNLDDIATTEQDPPLRLKSRNDVYYKLYKEMRQRAKEAKREALANYLEAKRIKSTYLLNDVSDSETEEEEDWEEHRNI